MTEKKMKACPLCGRYEKQDIVNICVEARDYVIDEIKKTHPDWVEKNGACPQCIEYYKKLADR